MNILEVLYKKKENIPCDFLIDEIDVDSYFFHNFWKFMLSKMEFSDKVKVSFRETYSIKEFTFDAHIAYQSYKLNAKLNLTKKETQFILEILKLIKQSFDNIPNTLFIPYPTPNFVKTPQESSLFLYFFKDFQNSKSCKIRFGLRYPEIFFEKIIKFDLSSQIYIKIKELDYLL